jgi:isopentenyl phosphate kinase
VPAHGEPALPACGDATDATGVSVTHYTPVCLSLTRAEPGGIRAKIAAAAVVARVGVPVWVVGAADAEAVRGALAGDATRGTLVRPADGEVR